MKLKIASIILFAFLVTGAYAQVTINSHINPEVFSIVQVESDTSGVRLPRMTSAQMAALQPTLTTNARAQGLIVYNETDKTLSYWNGTSWTTLFGASAENGITAAALTTVELGGNLTKTSTEIGQGSFDMNFTHTVGTSGEFTINSNKIDDSEVSLLPASSFTVNGSAMNVTAGAVSMNTNGANFSVNNTALQVTSSGTTVQGTLSYPHIPYDEGDLLASDAAGTATWAGIRPFGSLVRGVLNENSVNIQGAGTPTSVSITTTPIVLGPGKWVIFAKCTTTATYSTSSSVSKGMYHWMGLQSAADTNFNSPQFETSSGINPELSNTNNQVIYSCPSLVHFVDINTTRAYRVLMGTSNRLNDRTTSAFGGSYFYAIRIDIPTP